MTSEEVDKISITIVDQGDDQSGEWVVQHRGRVTVFTFGEIVQRRAVHAPLVERLLYNKPHITKAIKYGHDNEPKAQDLYCEYLHKFYHHQTLAKRTGFHIYINYTNY